MANTVINTPELLNLDSTTGATVLAKGTVADRPETPTFSLDYLVVAGGGGGTYSTNPGGGAGGLRTSYGSTSGGGEGAEPSLNVVSGTSFTVTVGAGGPKINASNISSPSRGGNSVFGTITSLGGAIGVTGNDSNGIPWTNGGSGAGGRYGGGLGGQGTAGQGFRGGSINGAPNYKAGGSGGAGGVGLDATGSDFSGASGNGGPGLAVNILNATNAATASVGEVSGSDVYYAGGGGGGSDSYRNRPAGSGGLGGGGNGGYYSNGTNGTANTGGGGGGGANRPSTMEAGDGGSGVVILRYPNSVSATVNGATQASGSPFTEGNDKITVLTSGTGTITFTDSTPTNPDEYPINGTLRFNTETNKTEYFDGTGWYEIVDEYASGFVGPATNYFDTKLFTGNGATQSIGGYINGAASFNGSSSKIESDVLQSTNMTFSCWFKTTTISEREYLMGFNTSGSAGYISTRLNANDTIGIAYWNGSTYAAVSSSAITRDTNYNHICITISGTSYTIYYNGSSIGSGTLSGFSASSRTDFVMGFDAPTGATGYMNGSLDQVRIYNVALRIYNVALSSSDVAALNLETAATATTAAFPSGQTAIATYTMDTSANGLLNTQDLSTVNYPAGAGCLALYEMNGNSNDTSGTYNGTPTNITYEGGAFDQAAVFNGSSSGINLPSSLNTSVIDATGAFSISMWINANDISTIQYLFCSNNSNNVDLGINTNNQGVGKIVWTIYNTSYSYLISTTTITTNTWYNIVVTYNNGLSELFINGASQGTITKTLLESSIEPTLGYRNTGGSVRFNGSIDQVRIFNTALTQSQVTTLARGIATSYSGAATDVNFNGYLNFQPDLVWWKNRDTLAWHQLHDSIRGAGNRIFSNDASATQYDAQSIKSFDSNGFTIGTSSDFTGDCVAWNWKAGGTAITNNEGTIASQVSANKDAGFSIVKFNGGNSSGTTVGHGLSQAPELIIVKNTSDIASWPVLTQTGYTIGATTFTLSGSSNYLALNLTYGYISYTFDQQLGGIANGGLSSDQLIAYCWHSVAGYSKIGSYTGNTTTLPSITLGFAPSFLIVKRTDSGDNWLVFDNKRNTTNPTNLALIPNSSAIESVGNLGNGFNFLSNGFQLASTDTGINANAGEYLYMAFA
jgi:hypothetical protein